MDWTKDDTNFEEGGNDDDELDTGDIHSNIRMRESHFNEFLKNSDNDLDIKRWLWLVSLCTIKIL